MNFLSNTFHFLMVVECLNSFYSVIKHRTITGIFNVTNEDLINKERRHKVWSVLLVFYSQ